MSANITAIYQSNINQQLTICQQMVKLGALTFFAMLCKNFMHLSTELMFFMYGTTSLPKSVLRFVSGLTTSTSFLDFYKLPCYPLQLLFPNNEKLVTFIVSSLSFNLADINRPNEQSTSIRYLWPISSPNKNMNVLGFPITWKNNKIEET